jgi:hypothetical protein
MEASEIEAKLVAYVQAFDALLARPELQRRQLRILRAVGALCRRYPVELHILSAVSGDPHATAEALALRAIGPVAEAVATAT